MSVVIEKGIDKATGPLLGGRSGGAGRPHNCLEMAEATSLNPMDYGEYAMGLRCKICGKERTVYFIKQLS